MVPGDIFNRFCIRWWDGENEAYYDWPGQLSACLGWPVPIETENVEFWDAGGA